MPAFFRDAEEEDDDKEEVEEEEEEEEEEQNGAEGVDDDVDDNVDTRRGVIDQPPFVFVGRAVRTGVALRQAAVAVARLW